MTKVVNIEIAAEDFDFLKNNKYALCFARKVNGVFNVVWQSLTQYFELETFSWVPNYEMFGTNTFQPSVIIKTSTQPVKIKLGEAAVLRESGRFASPYTSESPELITFINEYGPIYPGMSAVSTSSSGTNELTPIYVAPDQIATGEDYLTPIDVVMVWFEQDIVTSTMFSTARSKSVEIDLTTVDDAKRLFQDMKWSTPPEGAKKLLSRAEDK